MGRSTRRAGFIVGSVVIIALLTLLFRAVQPPATQRAWTTSFPNGVAAGDVTQDSAVLWARSAISGEVVFHYAADGGVPLVTITRTVTDPMLPVTATLGNLAPGVAYGYQVTNGAGESIRGRFRTPHQPGNRHGLRFGVSGDWRGDLAPYPAISNAPDRDLDFFLALGDTIYADFATPALPSQAETLDEFRLKHDEVYGPREGVNSFAPLRGCTALLLTIDDHEVLNDFAGGADAGRDRRFPEESGRINESARYRNAMQALYEYNPLRVEQYGWVDEGADQGRVSGKPRLYRYQRYGDDAALFVLDARSFRDLPIARPDPGDPQDIARFRDQTFNPARTMLGAPQLADLKRDLLDAEQQGVTWKFVVAPEPIQYLGLMSAPDRFEGFAAERTDLLRFIEENAIRNVVFLAADIHGTVVNNLSYQDGPNQPQIASSAIEITTGPVAFDGTYGHAVVSVAERDGRLSAEQRAEYDALPVHYDADSLPDDKDDFVREVIDRELVEFGASTIGLDDSAVDVTLLDGDYIATHIYGWTEFEIDAESQALTVAVYGIEPYSTADLRNDAAEVAGRQPVVVSRFVVAATGE